MATTKSTLPALLLALLLSACGGGTLYDEPTEHHPTTLPSVPAPDLPASAPTD